MTEGSSSMEETFKEDPDVQCDHIKTEMKTEEEELRSKTGGFLCPECSEHFCCDEYFVEHIREHHCDSVDIKQSNLKDAVNVEEMQDIVQNKSSTTRPNNPVDLKLSLSTRGLSDNNQETATSSDNTQGGSVDYQKALATDVLKKFNCSDCSYATNHKSHFLHHHSIHTGEKPFKCPDCEYTTARKSNLSTHQRTHAGEKPFICPDCDYATHDKSHLVRHQRTHTGEKPFICPDCDYATHEKFHLASHQRTHTSEKPYKCPDCDYATRHKSTLVRHHQRAHSGEKLLNKCADCSYSAAQKSNLVAHRRRKHKESLP